MFNTVLRTSTWRTIYFLLREISMGASTLMHQLVGLPKTDRFYRCSTLCGQQRNGLLNVYLFFFKEAGETAEEGGYVYLHCELPLS